MISTYNSVGSSLNQGDLLQICFWFLSTSSHFFQFSVPGNICFIYEKGGSQNGYPPFFILNTLNRKLYIRKMTPPQMRTATCCVLGSDMRGTLSAREIVANERSPSNRLSA